MDNFIEIGQRASWGGEQPFGLSRSDRNRHVHAIGMSGSGKTTLLKRLIVGDLLDGVGLAVLDPHGDLAEELLDLIPPWRSDDLVYFDPADLDFPIGFNLLRQDSVDRRYLVGSGIVSALKTIWRESFGPRMEHILANGVAALCECENVSLLGLNRMLVDARYRHWVLKQVRDPAVLQFWEDEFASWDSRFRTEAIAPVLNKIGALLLSPPLRNVLGQVRSAFDPRWIMDHRKIFIANLSKGRLGHESSNLLGALLVASFNLAAMSRADVTFEKRVPFHLCVDEFSSFAGDAFASILSEARKYSLSLVLSHQHLSQLRPEIVDSILGNVGTTISFRVGEQDAETLSRQYGNSYPPSAFTALGNHEVLVRKLDEGKPCEPFAGRTARPDHVVFGRKESLRRRSRERYGASRAKVESNIRRWMRGRE